MSEWHKKAAEEIDEYLSTSGLESNWDATKQIAAIIERHDPNRWIPVSEASPDFGLYVEFVANGSVWHGACLTTAWVSDDDADIAACDVTHWRPIVLPEVKS